jgi:hypothetical protein
VNPERTTPTRAEGQRAMIAAICCLLLALMLAGCGPQARAFSDYSGGTEAERASALMECKERTNTAFKDRMAVGIAPVARLHSEMAEFTDLCMRARGFRPAE